MIAEETDLTYHLSQGLGLLVVWFIRERTDHVVVNQVVADVPIDVVSTHLDALTWDPVSRIGLEDERSL